MTGSGKTGLCMALLEEAAIDGIPAIAIDPKGDLGNLLLTFPELRPEDFLPWVDPAEASAQGTHARGVRREDGRDLARGPGRMGRGRRADREVPRRGRHRDLHARQRRRAAADGAALVRRAAARLCSTDPSACASGSPRPSRACWRWWASTPTRFAAASTSCCPTSSTTPGAGGTTWTWPALMRQIQTPPFEKVGVVDLETFFPAKERFELAMKLNNLLASPGFAAWMEGEPLDIGGLLYTAAGKPRLSIVSIAHLSDAERMFFVTILLNEVLAWMRTQSGTSSLRAMLYMDEMFGYFPADGQPAVEDCRC